MGTEQKLNEASHVGAAPWPRYAVLDSEDRMWAESLTLQCQSDFLDVTRRSRSRTPPQARRGPRAITSQSESCVRKKLRKKSGPEAFGEALIAEDGCIYGLAPQPLESKVSILASRRRMP